MIERKRRRISKISTPTVNLNFGAYGRSILAQRFGPVFILKLERDLRFGKTFKNSLIIMAAVNTIYDHFGDN